MEELERKFELIRLREIKIKVRDFSGILLHLLRVNQRFIFLSRKCLSADHV